MFAHALSPSLLHRPPWPLSFMLPKIERPSLSAARTSSLLAVMLAPAPKTWAKSAAARTRLTAPALARVKHPAKTIYTLVPPFLLFVGEYLQNLFVK